MIYDNLELNGIKSLSNVDGRRFSLWGSGGGLSKVYYPQNDEELTILLSCLEDYYIVGRGSNLLISDEGYNGNVISTNLLQDMIPGETIHCGAGVTMAKLTKFSRERGLSGLEELSGIPTSIGGAVIGNAGAYGREISELIDYVELYIQGKLIRLNYQDIQFTYRDSSLRGYVIAAVGLKLAESDRDAVERQINSCREKRYQSQPQEQSLGSVFKANGNTPAAIYIQELDIKGYSIGDAMVSPKHCNFIVNKGKATTKDYINLAVWIQDRVYERFGALLETEVQYLGAIDEDFRRLSYPY